MMLQSLVKRLKIVPRVKHIRYLLYYHYINHLFTGKHILVYQMGKVGSTSVYSLAKAAGYQSVHHFHYANPDEIAKWSVIIRRSQKGIQAIRNLVHRGKPVIVICLVRDPLMRNISWFFEDLHKWALRDNPTLLNDQTALQKAYFASIYPKDGLNWFDEEFRTTLGINVYDYPFDHDKGYIYIKHDNIDAIIIKLEIGDDKIQSALRECLDDPEFIFFRKNESASKDYRDAYDLFKKTTPFAQEYLDGMYNSRLATHFYTPDEINEFRSRWVCATGKPVW